GPHRERGDAAPGRARRLQRAPPRSAAPRARRRSGRWFAPGRRPRCACRLHRGAGLELRRFGPRSRARGPVDGGARARGRIRDARPHPSPAARGKVDCKSRLQIGSESMTRFLWANSGDSHYMEPPNLYDDLPDHLKERMPKTVRDEARGVEVITVDGQSFEQPLPTP